MIKNIWLGMLFLLVAAAGCKNNWDDFYGGDQDERSAGATMNMFQMLQQYPERYSKFLSLTEQTGVDAYLKSNRMMTLWVPGNNYITDELLEKIKEPADKKRFVLNHLNVLALYNTKLASKNEIRTLAGKYIAIRRGYNGYYVENNALKVVDMACTNGVIHEIAGALTPTKNIMEYINEAGPDYSLYRDSLWAYNDTTFDREASFPIGVDSVGRTLYDSIFIIENTLLKTIDFNDEKGEYTLFIPSNKTIEEMFQEQHEYFKSLGREFTHQDTLSCFKWMLRATYFHSKYLNLSMYRRLFSAGGSELRFEKQILRTDYSLCSNGVVYDYEKVYIPHDMFMTSLDFMPTDLFELPESQWADYYKLSYNGVLNKTLTNDGDNLTDNLFADKSNSAWHFLSVKAAKGEWMEIKTLVKDKLANIVEGKLMPGKYKLSGRFYGYRCANTKISINGDPLIWHKDKSTTFPTGSNNETDGFEYKKTYPMCDTVYIKEQYGYKPLSIRLESLGTGGKPDCIRVMQLKFEPVGDNY